MNHLPDLSSVQGFILDIDGTLALADGQLQGYQALPGTAELLALLAQRSIPHVLFTNGSTKTPVQLAHALVQAGIPVAAEQVLTPPVVAVALFQRLHHQRVLVLGGQGVWQPLLDAGIQVVRAPQRCDDADAVLVGWHPDFGLADMEAACHAVWAGAKLYSVSNAPWLASREGRTLGISGALCSAIHSITGVAATVVGKPAVQAFEVAQRILDVPAANIAVVGDDLSLENAMAHACGAVSITVLTGLADEQAIAHLPHAMRSHHVFAGVGQLVRYLQGG